MNFWRVFSNETVIDTLNHTRKSDLIYDDDQQHIFNNHNFIYVGNPSI